MKAFASSTVLAIVAVVATTLSAGVLIALQVSTTSRQRQRLRVLLVTCAVLALVITVFRFDVLA